MRKLIMWNVVTLDGRFEGEEPWDLDFHGLVWGEELEKYSDEQLQTVDLLVYGENTYKGMYDYWSKEEGKTADKLNEVAKIVCSPTLEKADWNNTRIVRDAVPEITKLKEEGDGNIFVFGSSILSESLINADLFDEYRLCVAPVILGKGRHLFTEKLHYQKLKLLDTQTLSTGGVILRYGRS